MQSSYADCTLRDFLLVNLECQFLPSANYVQLKAMNSPDGQGTLADHVSRDDFEHICLKFGEHLSVHEVLALVEKYYAETEHKIDFSQGDETCFAMIVLFEDKTLTIIGILEQYGVMNIAVM